MVDHPKRKAEGIRDATIKTAGLTTGITGLHFTHAVLDDVVVKENAYTEEGRKKVEGQYSLLSSIESTGTDEHSSGAFEWAVGTRYNANDLYGTLIQMEEEVFSKEGEIVGTELVYEVFEREVEDRGDGSGEFLWPRQQNKNGRWYGFNAEILAKKRAKYLDKMQYYCQYYNNTSANTDGAIPVDQFQYYERKNVYQASDGDWYIRDRKLKVYAAIDFAYSLREQADYTALVVVGVDADHNYYVLDIDRFKTKKPSVYFSHILNAYSKWGFRKIRAEITAAQVVIVESLREDYIKPNGIPLKIDEYRPTRNEGDKEERINAVLEPRYDNGQIFHYKGGNCQSLEEELKVAKPPHDDIKDALANAIAIAKAPIKEHRKMHNTSNVVYHSRFGGAV